MKRLFCLALLIIFTKSAQFVPLYGQNNTESIYGRLLKAQEDYKKAITSGDSSLIADASYVLGKRFILVKNYPRAQQWLLKSLDIKKQKGALFDVGRIYLRLGEIQVFLDNFQEADRYTKLADQTFKKDNSVKGMIGSSRFRGEIFQHLWENGSKNKMLIDSALNYYRSSLQLAQSIPDTADMAYSLQAIGRNFDARGDLRQSLIYYFKASAIYEKHKLESNIVDVATKIGGVWLRLNQPDSAKIWLDKALLANNEKSAQLGTQEAVLFTVGKYYEQKGDLETALRYHKEVSKINELNEKNGFGEAINSVNMAYENELNINKLAAEKNEKLLIQKNLAAQKKFTYTLIGLFFVIALVCLLFYRLYVKYRKTSAENAILVREQNHRTKNNLQSVTDLLSLQLYQLTDPKAVEALEESLLRVHAVTLVHRSLYQGDELVYIDLPKFIPDLVHMVLKTYRQEAVTVQYDIENILLHTDQTSSLGLIINELTTNACKYAFSNHPDPFLHVSCHFNEGSIEFLFSDNGPGLPPSISKHEGFGLDLIRILVERLKTIANFSNMNGCQFRISFSGDTKHPLTGIKEKHKA